MSSLSGDLVDCVREFSPELLRDLKKGRAVPIDAMDPYFRTWTRLERKNGKIKRRLISEAAVAPLKRAHSRILRVTPVFGEENVYSYARGKSQIMCASNHVKMHGTLMIDLKDFFFSFTRSMLEEFYRGIMQKAECGQDESDFLARLISTICTIRHPGAARDDEAVMPMGIQPAGAITNTLPRGLDRKLMLLCKKRDYVYSRYSDNMYISSKDVHLPRELTEEIVGIIESYTYAGQTPFRVNRDKTRYRPYWRHQRVLGVCVNEKPNISRRRENWLRSAIHHLYIELDRAISDHDAGTLDDEAFTVLVKKKARRYRKVQGNLNWARAVNLEKYFKYETKHFAASMLLTAALARVRELEASK